VGFNNVIKWVIVVLFITTLVFIFWRFDPNDKKFFPTCPFYYLTGYRCIGCGSQRAIHSLLNLNLHEAIKDNLLVVISIPYLISGFVFDSIKQPSMKILKWRKILFGTKAIIIILIILLSFWVLRNLPILQHFI